MGIDVQNFINEMSKHSQDRFEKGELLIKCVGSQVEVIEKKAISKESIKHQAVFHIDTFSRSIVDACNKAKGVDRAKLEESKSKYFALLQHVFCRRNSPNWLLSLLQRLPFYKPQDPKEKAADDLTKLLGRGNFERLNRCHFEESIKARKKELEHAIEEKREQPGMHFEAHFLKLIKSKIDQKPERSYLLFMMHDSRDALTKFAQSLPPALDSEAMAQKLWMKFSKSKSTLAKFLREQQQIIEEPSFTALAAKLRKGKLKPLEESYLIHQASRRVTGECSKEQLRTIMADLRKTFSHLQMIDETLKERFEDVERAKERLKVVKEKMGEALSDYTQEFQDIENIFTRLEDLNNFLWPREGKEKAKHPHLTPEYEFYTLRAELHSAIKELESSSPVIAKDKATFMAAISHHAGKVREELNKITANIDLKPIILHPGFSAICHALSLSRAKPIDRAVQDRVIDWLSKYAKAENKKALFNYIPRNAKMELEKYRKNLMKYEVSLKLANLQLDLNIKELEELLRSKSSEQFRLAPRINNKNLKRYTEEYIEKLKKNYRQVMNPKNYDIEARPASLLSGIEKKMNEIRKAFWSV
jgi:hypothetical protein